MRLCAEVIDLVRLDLLDQADQVGRIGEIAVMQYEAAAGLMRVLIQMVDTIGIEQRGTALDAVDLVALVEQQFGQISAVLAGNAGNQCPLHFDELPFLIRW
jgi:hypothetical protein